MRTLSIELTADTWRRSSMMTSPYHTKYFAYELTRRAAAHGIDRLSQSLFDACVHLNPHQIEAALFALRPHSAPEAATLSL